MIISIWTAIISFDEEKSFQFTPDFLVQCYNFYNYSNLIFLYL